MSVTVLQPPPLTEEHRKRISPSVLPRYQAERRIVWNLIQRLAVHEYQPLEVEHDDIVPTPNNIETMFNEIFEVEDCYLFFAKRGDKAAKRWVRIVLGNGIDCISDYGHNKTDEEWNSLMDSFNPELFV